MNNGKLERNESMLSEERRLMYLQKAVKGQITAKDVEFIFVSMSEKGQDMFLESLKDVLPRKEWEGIVMHLKSYDMAMLGDFRPRDIAIKENLGLALYEHFANDTDASA